MPKMYIKRMKNSTSFINKAERNKKEETKKKKKNSKQIFIILRKLLYEVIQRYILSGESAE